MQPIPLLKKLSLGALALLSIPTITQADVEDRLYDFTDAYYLQNGVNPAAISGRRQPGPNAAEDTPIFACSDSPDFPRGLSGWLCTSIS